MKLKTGEQELGCTPSGLDFYEEQIFWFLLTWRWMYAVVTNQRIIFWQCRFFQAREIPIDRIKNVERIEGNIWIGPFPAIRITFTEGGKDTALVVGGWRGVGEFQALLSKSGLQINDVVPGARQNVEP